MAVRATAVEYIAVTDATGERRELLRYPRRIVSLAPSVTQTLLDLGLDAEIVGITKSCPHPRDRAKNADKLGPAKEPDIGALVDLVPDVVFMDLEQNREEDVERLTGKVPLYVARAGSIEEAIASLETIGILVDREEQASSIAREIRTEVEASRAWARDRVRVRTACLLARDPYEVAGANSYLADILGLHGLDNVFGSRGEATVSIEIGDLVTAAPGLILLSSEPFRFRPKHRDDLLKVEDIPASRAGCVHLIDGAHLNSQGTRMRRSLPFLREFLEKVLDGEEDGKSDD